MQVRIERADLSGRRLAGYALGALLYAPLYMLMVFMLARVTGLFRLETVETRTFVAVVVGMFAVLFALHAGLSPRARRGQEALGGSSVANRQAIAPFGALYADDTLSTREKIAALWSTWTGILQALACALIVSAIVIGRFKW